MCVKVSHFVSGPGATRPEIGASDAPVVLEFGLATGSFRHFFVWRRRKSASLRLVRCAVPDGTAQRQRAISQTGQQYSDASLSTRVKRDRSNRTAGTAIARAPWRPAGAHGPVAAGRSRPLEVFRREKIAEKIPSPSELEESELRLEKIKYKNAKRRIRYILGHLGKCCLCSALALHMLITLDTSTKHQTHTP